VPGERAPEGEALVGLVGVECKAAVRVTLYIGSTYRHAYIYIHMYKHINIHMHIHT